MDTIIVCGKTGELYALTGLSASGREKDLKTALYLALRLCVDNGYLDLIMNGAFLTPDNAEKIYPRLVKLVSRIMGEPMPPPGITKYSDYVLYVRQLSPAIARYMPHRMVHTEEESVRYVRTVSTPMFTLGIGIIPVQEPIGNLPLPGLHTSTTTVQFALPYHLPQLCCFLLCALQGWGGWTRAGATKVVTLRDREGVIFNTTHHLVRLPGLPRWEDVDTDTNICTTDPCANSLTLRRLANITHSEGELLSIH